MKCEEVMPIRRASAFICSMKAASDPPTVSLIATATSFADLTSRIFSALSSVSACPGLKYILLAGSAAAFLDITTGESSVSRPDLMARKVV